MNARKTKLMALAAGALIAASFGSAANAAAPIFTVTPTALGVASPAAFQANNFSGNSSELLTITGTTTISGEGWVDIGQFNCNGGPPCTVINPNSGVNSTYQLYILFTLTDHVTMGTVGGNPSAYTLDTLNFTIVGDPHAPGSAGAATFTSAQTPATMASVTPGTGDDVLAAGSLISGTAGIGLNSLAADLNSTENFLLCTGSGTGTIGSTVVTGGPLASNCTDGVGRAFFTQPPTFFTMAFDGFTCSGLDPNCVTSTDGTHIAINDAVGTVDFAPVPEPGTLAMFGSGVLFVGWLVRRRKNRRLA